MANTHRLHWKNYPDEVLRRVKACWAAANDAHPRTEGRGGSATPTDAYRKEGRWVKSYINPEDAKCKC